MLNYSIIAQTDDWMLINKPINASIHGSGEQQGLVYQVKIQQQLEFLAPVHRLDDVTSGCLLLAKNSNAASYLSQQFAKRSVGKVYIAITQGKPNKKQGKIMGDMKKSRDGNWKLARTHENPAITQFKSIGMSDGLRLVWLYPQTGKTHQLRVAMKSIGSPILGDNRYGKSNSDRCYLHSYELAFTDLDETPLKFKCLPSEGEWFLKSEFLNCLSASITL